MVEESTKEQMAVNESRLPYAHYPRGAGKFSSSVLNALYERYPS